MNSPKNNISGLGSVNANIKVYIENRPPLPQYQELTSVIPLPPSEILNIGALTGNHWRKIFNVYAKLIFELNTYGFNSWQALRDSYLLQKNSNESLIFSKLTASDLEDKSTDRKNNTIHIVMGKTYARKLELDSMCYWLSESFAINESKKMIVCPYFDYRQLSNIRISQLVQLIKQLK
jgi:hypothetical protein